MAPSTSQPGLPLSFDGLLVIVGGGAVDDALLKELDARGAAVVAADGGADICAEAGVTPVAIMGDMDSIRDLKSWEGRAEIFRIEEQETTDFEKCLYGTKARVTLALGMTGRRFDHTLAAIDTVARFASKRHIILVDESDIALAVSGAFSFTVGEGERVSVHPLGEVRFAHSDGLKYPLDGLALAPGVRTGTSNHAVGGPFVITPEEGNTTPWLLLIDRKHLDTLVAELARK